MLNIHTKLNEILKENNKELIEKGFQIKVLEESNADNCLKLQDTLTIDELKLFTKRSKETYEKLIKSGLMIGIFRVNNKGEEELVAQIASSLENTNHSYIRSDNQMIAELLNEGIKIEQGAYIVHKDCRGHGLQSELERNLALLLKDLLERQEKLNDNMERLKQCQLILVVSGCSSKNPASALTSLKNNSILIGVEDGTIINGEKEKLVSYALMKVLSDKRNKEKINFVEDDSQEAQDLLREREEASKSDQNNKILPESWVEKVSKNGGLIMRQNKEIKIVKSL